MNLKAIFSLKRVLLTLAILLLLAFLAWISVMLIKHRNKLERFNEAVAAFDAGNYEKAKPLLRQCLEDEYNIEPVNEKLAIIAEKEKEWPQAAYHWRQAAHLNPFKPEYKESYLQSLCMTRDFGEIIDTLELQSSLDSITQDQHVLLAYCHYAQDDMDKARKAFANVTDETAKKTTLATIVAFLLDTEPHTVKQSLEFLQQYHDNEDPFIAFETLYASAIRCIRIRDMENGTKFMAKASEIAPIVGKPLQAEYLYSIGFVSEAMKVLEQCNKNYARNDLAAMLGECYTITQQTEKLADLREKFKSGNNERIMTGYYLESLHNYLEQDGTSLAQNLNKWDKNFLSPIATLVKLYAVTHKGDNEEVTKEDVETTITLLRSLNRFARKQPNTATPPNEGQEQANDDNGSPKTSVFFNTHDHAFYIAMQYILKLVKNQKTDFAGRIAEVLQEFEIPQAFANQENTDRLLARLVIGHKLADNKLRISDINSAREKFPNDPILLNFFSRYYLTKRNFKAAIQLAQANLANIQKAAANNTSGNAPATSNVPFIVQLLNSIEQYSFDLASQARQLELKAQKWQEQASEMDAQNSDKKDKTKTEGAEHIRQEAAGFLKEAEKLRKQVAENLKEAQDVAQELLKEKEQIAANISYINFCSAHGLIDKLNEYVDSIGDSDSANRKALREFTRAQLAYIQDKKEDVPTHLDKITEAVAPAILFKVALLYAAVQKFDKANMIYQRIMDNGTQTPTLLINMSENFAATGQNEKALEYAKNALDMAPNNPILQETYAIRLIEQKQEAEAFTMLDRIVKDGYATERGLFVWHDLMVKRIKELLEEQNWQLSLKEANRVLAIFTEDEEILKAKSQSEEAIKEIERVKAAEKAAEDAKLKATEEAAP